jgi:hypothetical protein
LLCRYALIISYLLDKANTKFMTITDELSTEIASTRQILQLIKTIKTSADIPAQEAKLSAMRQIKDYLGFLSDGWGKGGDQGYVVASAKQNRPGSATEHMCGSAEHVHVRL